MKSRIVIGIIICMSLFRLNASAETIRIGINAEITGSIPMVGESCVNAAQLAVDEINQSGGIMVQGIQYTLELVVRDNEDNADRAVEITNEFVTIRDTNTVPFLAMVGPNASRNAIPASEVAEDNQLLMISPWSTNVLTTQDKEWVFRTPFTDDFQGIVMANFAFHQLGITNAAVLFDETDPYNSGIASFFKDNFESLGGTITTYETYISGDQDFSTQIQMIVDSNADLLFLPNFFNDVPSQIAQARSAGYQGIIAGSDGWNGSTDLFSLGTELMEGTYFSAHYASSNDTPTAKTFINAYLQRFNSVPDDVAGLTYDTLQVLLAAVRYSNSINPALIRTAYSQLGIIDGVTGKIQYSPDSGTPTKNAVILQIHNGAFEYFTSAGPLQENSFVPEYELYR
jgi:branched-chain amino acid transport system substrate-binding protein